MDTKPFDIITEADARVLPPGTTVRLARHGHVTPLADDTLRARRITVLREDGVPSGAAATLAPPAEIRRLVIGSDHTGVALKKRLVDWCRARGLAIIDAGVSDGTPADYPDVAAAVARPVARGEAEAGIVIDGAGLGSAIAANKVRGIRAAMCATPTLARYAREHNGANVLALGATLLSPDEAVAIVETFLSTSMKEARYIARLAKVKRLEEAGY
jgi:ribose 5-phosphate isomerase B